MEYKARRCECSDPGCPAKHGSRCLNRARVTLYRIDMEDNSGTRMCLDCADDAMECGLFTEEADEGIPGWAERPGEPEVEGT
jgi:hypothetical protein